MKTEHTCWVNGWQAASDAIMGEGNTPTLTLRRLFSRGGMFMVDQDQRCLKMIAWYPDH